MDLKKYFEKDKKILVICSQPIDADSLCSGLILTTYLESQGKNVNIIFPRKKRKEDDNYSYLPYFNRIVFTDSREIVGKNKFDALILIDGTSLVQFYDDSKINEGLIDISVFPKRLHIDHHQGQPENLGTEIIHNPVVSSTTEIILTELVPDDFVDKKIATLGYAALLGDTGTFQWNIYPSTFKLAGLLLEKGAEAGLILDKLSFNKDKQYFELLAFVINSTVWRDDLGSCFLFLPKKLIKKEGLDAAKVRIVKEIFCYNIARRVLEYPLGFFIADDMAKPGTIFVSARGSELRNKLNLPKFFISLGGNGGGHFNAAGMDCEEEFEKYKEKLLSMLEKALKADNADKD